MRADASTPREGGQAMVFAAILLLAVVVGIGVLYNTGRLSLDKTRLQNTADSAAYSSGVLLARSYNFSAYANRAMVANQVVIAQMVGLRSWSQYYCLAYNDQCSAGQNQYDSANDLPGQIASGGGPIWSLYSRYISQPIFGSVDMDSRSRSSSVSSDFGAVAIAKNSNTIIQQLSKLSQSYFRAVEQNLEDASSGAGIVHTIIQANYPELSASDRPYLGSIGKGIWLDDLAQVKAYTTLYGSNRQNHMALFATVVQNSLDQWTKNRMASGGMTTSESPPFPLFNVHGAGCTHRWVTLWVNYDGTTSWNWQGSNPNWSASDNAQIYGFTFIPIPFFGGCILFPTRTNPSIFFWPTTLSQATAEYGKSTSHHFPIGYVGLEPYEDVSQANLTTTATPILSLDLVRKHNTIATTQNLGVDQGNGKVGIGATNQLDIKGNEANGEMAALASVQLHFVRPGGAQHQRLLGGEVEYGTLFNPYWQAHLVPNPTTTRTFAQSEQEAGG